MHGNKCTKKLQNFQEKYFYMAVMRNKKSNFSEIFVITLCNFSDIIATTDY